MKMKFSTLILSLIAFPAFAWPADATSQEITRKATDDEVQTLLTHTLGIVVKTPSDIESFYYNDGWTIEITLTLKSNRYHSGSTGCGKIEHHIKQTQHKDSDKIQYTNEEKHLLGFSEGADECSEIKHWIIINTDTNVRAEKYLEMVNRLEEWRASVTESEFCHALKYKDLIVPPPKDYNTCRSWKDFNSFNKQKIHSLSYFNRDDGDKPALEFTIGPLEKWILIAPVGTSDDPYNKIEYLLQRY